MPTTTSLTATRFGAWARRIRPSGRCWGGAMARRAGAAGNHRQGEDIDIEGQGEVLHIAAEPTPGARTMSSRKRQRQHRRRDLHEPAQLLRDHAATASCRRKIALDLRRRSRSGMDAEDPGHPAREARAGNLLHHRRERRDPRRSLIQREVAEGDEVGNHTFTHPNLGESPPRHGGAGAQRHAAAVRGADRSLHAPVPCALLRRRRTDHRRRDSCRSSRRRKWATSPSGCTWTRTTGSARVRTRSSSSVLAEVTSPDPDASAARSCCCTTAAATARRRSRRCRC